MRRRLIIQRDLPFPPEQTRRSPAEIAAEMRSMARLHPKWMWASLMLDGADAIDRLLKHEPGKER